MSDIIKIEKVDENSVKITGPKGTKIGEKLTPEQLIADLAKHLAKTENTGVEPNCAVCIAN
jgi:hypothetical protein